MKFFKKIDIIIITIITIVCILSLITYNFISRDKPAKAEIYYKSELIQTVELNTGVDKTFSIPQDENVVFHLYKDGSIRFGESDCPDKVCVNTGKLKTVGQTAACLPNEIILKIIPDGDYSEDEPDIIIG